MSGIVCGVGTPCTRTFISPYQINPSTANCEDAVNKGKANWLIEYQPLTSTDKGGTYVWEYWAINPDGTTYQVKDENGQYVGGSINLTAPVRQITPPRFGVATGIVEYKAGVRYQIRLKGPGNCTFCNNYAVAPPCPSKTPTPSPSRTPSKTVTPSPTASPSVSPSKTPSRTPSSSASPSRTPSSSPSKTPSNSPSKTPSKTPSTSPSSSPSKTPSRTISPTPSISITPTATPSITASITPSITASVSPSKTPSRTNTPSPSITRTPSRSVSATPSSTASITPSITTSISTTPSTTPSITASISVSSTVSRTPSRTVSRTATPTPTITPSITRSVSVSPSPSKTPSKTPSVSPSSNINRCNECLLNVSYSGDRSNNTCDTTHYYIGSVSVAISVIDPSCLSGLTYELTSTYSDGTVITTQSPTLIRQNIIGCPTCYSYDVSNILSTPVKIPRSVNGISITETTNVKVYYRGVLCRTVTGSGKVCLDAGSCKCTEDIAAPSKSVSRTPTITPTITPSITRSITASPTRTVTRTITPTPSTSISITPSATISPTPSTSNGCVVTTTDNIIFNLVCREGGLYPTFNLNNVISANACSCGFSTRFRWQSYEQLGSNPLDLFNYGGNTVCNLGSYNQSAGRTNLCVLPVGTVVTYTLVWELENLSLPVVGPTAGTKTLTYTVTQEDKNSCSNCPAPASPSATPSITPSSTPPNIEGIPCGAFVKKSFDNAYPGIFEVNVGSQIGQSTFSGISSYIPMRYTITQGATTYDTGYRGHSDFNYDGSSRDLFVAGLRGKVDPKLNQVYPILSPPNNSIAPDGYPYVVDSQLIEIPINKTETSSTVVVKTYASIDVPFSDESIWIKLSCLDPNVSPSSTPSVTISPTPSLSSNFIGNPPEGTIRCGESTNLGDRPNRETNYDFFVGSSTGYFTADVTSLYIPTAFVISYNGTIRSTSNFYGNDSYSYGGFNREYWKEFMKGKTIPGTSTSYPIDPPINGIAPDGYPYVLSTEGTIIFNKQDTNSNTITVSTFGNEGTLNYFDIKSYCLTDGISPSPSKTPSTTPSISISSTPSITPSISISPSPSITPSITASISVSPSITPSITISPSPTMTPDASASTTPSITPTITITPSITPTISISPTRTITPSRTVSPSPSISISPSRTPSITPTPSPSQQVCDPYGTFISYGACTGTCNVRYVTIADGFCSFETITEGGHSECTSGCCPTAGSIVGTITCTACQQSTHLIANGSCGSTPSPFYDSFCTDNDLCCPGCGLAGCDGNFDCCDCYGDVCGTDNCGNSCGTCGGGTSCVSGQCCEPYGTPLYTECIGCETTRSYFADGSCGSDFSDYSTPGECNSVEWCPCTPDCAGKSCGSDGCGGSCGDCIQGSQDCDFNTGQCIWINECDPPCTGECEQCQGTVCATIC